MLEQTFQSIESPFGVLRCETMLRENLYLGRIEHPGGHERACVLQFIPAHLSEDASNRESGYVDELAQRRFLNEAMIGLDVTRDHINLITTLHVGRWPCGDNRSRLFIAVDCIEGRTVSELAEELFGAYAKIRNVIHHLLQALAHLHRRGIIHGSVVGSNVLIAVDGVIRLGDFSQAKRTSHAARASGVGHPDLLALGRLLFELLTGVPHEYVGDREISELLPPNTPIDLSTVIVQLLDDSGRFSSIDALSPLSDDREPLVFTRKLINRIGVRQSPTTGQFPAVSASDPRDAQSTDEYERVALTSNKQITNAQFDMLAGKLAALLATPIVNPQSETTSQRWRLTPIAIVIAICALLLAAYSVWAQSRSHPLQKNVTSSAFVHTPTDSPIAHNPGDRLSPPTGSSDTIAATQRAQKSASPDKVALDENKRNSTIEHNRTSTPGAVTPSETAVHVSGSSDISDVIDAKEYRKRAGNRRSQQQTDAIDHSDSSLVALKVPSDPNRDTAVKRLGSVRSELTTTTWRGDQLSMLVELHNPSNENQYVNGIKIGDDKQKIQLGTVRLEMLSTTSCADDEFVPAQSVCSYSIQLDNANRFAGESISIQVTGRAGTYLVPITEITL